MSITAATFLGSLALTDDKGRKLEIDTSMDKPNELGGVTLHIDGTEVMVSVTMIATVAEALHANGAYDGRNTVPDRRSEVMHALLDITKRARAGTL